MKKNVRWAGVWLVIILLTSSVIPACAFSPGKTSSATQQNEAAPQGAITVEALAGVSAETAKEVQQAAAAAERFFRDQVGVRLASPVHIVLTPNRKTYVKEVMQRFAVSELEAERITKGTNALSGNKLIVADISGISTIRQKTYLMTHELTHEVQRQIAGSEASSVMWMLEGLADTTGAQVVAQQGYLRIDQYRDNWQGGLRSMADKPRLGELTSSRDWSAAMARYGASATYKTAGLAVLTLVERYGQQKVWDYFAEVGRGQAPETAFQRIFGLSMAAFSADFDRSIRKAS